MKNEGDPATLHFDGKRESPDPGLATVDQAQGSDPANMGIGTDKKRGKLNYHRAGTACSKEIHTPPLFPSPGDDDKRMLRPIFNTNLCP